MKKILEQLPELGTKEFNDLASAYFGGKPKQETNKEAAEIFGKSLSEDEVINNDLTVRERICLVGSSIVGFEFGARWKEDNIVDDLEKKWLEYRQYTNNTDAWSFKDWLIQQYKK